MENLNNKRKFAYIFDIDGTLACGEHRVHHLRGDRKDWKSYNDMVHMDNPIYPVVHTYHALNNASNNRKNWEMFIFSGREASLVRETETWLFSQCFISVKFNKDFFMRPKGDYRNDAIIKKEMLVQIRDNGFEPIAVFDDRDRVIQMWRENGVYVFNCDRTSKGGVF